MASNSDSDLSSAGAVAGDFDDSDDDDEVVLPDEDSVSEEEGAIADVESVSDDEDLGAIAELLQDVESDEGDVVGGRRNGDDGSEDALGANEVCCKSYGSTRVVVVKDKLADQKVDVLVNTTSKQLDLSKGAASKALLAKGGDSIQTECRTKYPNGLSQGQVAVTGAGNLCCKHVYHMCLPSWQDGRSKEVLQQLVMKCLLTASQANLTSIAFPALGTGHLGYDKRTVAKCTFKCVERFQSTNPGTSVHEVRLVIFPSDHESLQEFKAACQGRDVDTSDRTVCSQTIRNVTVRLVVGNLTKQKCDVLMSSSTRKLDLSRGIVSKSVCDGAGTSLQNECTRKYPSGIKHGEVAVLGPGNLSCKAVYCGALPRHDKPQDSGDPVQLMVTLVTSCLTQATKDGHTSIGFPTLGSGYLMYPPQVSARTMLKAIHDFSANNPTSSVNTVFIVIYAKEETIAKSLQAFQKELDSYKAGAPPARPVPSPRRRNKPLPALPVLPIPQRPSTAPPTAPSPAPARNTPEYCLYRYQSDVYPPRHWTKFKSHRTVKNWKVQLPGEAGYQLIKVDSNTFRAVEALVMKSWEPRKLGQGRDAQGLADIAYKGLKVRKVHRVENLSQYEKYTQKQQELFHKAGKGPMFTPLSQVPGVKHGAAHTDQYLSPAMRDSLYGEINEMYLFHGTPADRVDNLCKQGVDIRMAQGHAVFGQAAYMAESSTKADQYTDKRDDRKTKDLRMFLMRASLGQICLLNETKKFRRPPCLQKCDQDDCSHERYDSIVEEDKYIFREFVVYDSQQTYPEYVITYDRV